MEVGSKLVYPMHGAGVVTDVSIEDFFGEDLNFCTLNIVQKDMVLKFPESKADELNIRNVSTMEEIIESIRAKEIDDYITSSNWNKRYQTTLVMLKEGKPSDIAGVLVNLKSLDNIKGLSSGERQLYHNALDILASEIMLIEDIKYEKACDLIENELEEVCECAELSDC